MANRQPLQIKGPSTTGEPSPEHAEDATRFAALVQCSLEEAQDWLHRNAWTMEATLDSYLAHQRKSKRPRSCREAHVSHKTAVPTSINPEATSPSFLIPLEADTMQNAFCREGSLTSPTRMRVAKRAASPVTATTPSKVLMIEVADDSEDEPGIMDGDPAVCDPSSVSSSGELGDEKSGHRAEVRPRGPTEERPPPSLSHLPDDFSFCLGECVANGTVTSGIVSRLSLTDPLALLVEVRIAHAQRQGTQQGPRKTKVSNSGYKIVYIHLNDPLLLEHQKRLGQPGAQRLSRSPPSTAGPFSALPHMKGAVGFRGYSSLAGIDFHNLLSSISEQTIFLRLLIDGRDAVRFDRQVASSLATLLLLGAIKVDVSWVPDRLPPRRLAINSTLSVRMTVHVTVQALRLSALRQTGDPYLSQLHFPVLMGQAFSSLVQLLSLQPIGSSWPSRARDAASDATGASEDKKLRQQLETLKGARPPASSGASDVGESEEAPAVGTHGNDDGEMKEDGCSAQFEDEVEASDNSAALCQLVLGGDAAPGNAEQQRHDHRRLGALYPPACVFRSQLRPYQAQGLWWMLQCETEQSVFLKDQHEALDPAWTMYRLPRQANAPGAGSCFARADSSEGQAVRGSRAPPDVFNPSHLYVNVTAGLVSLEKPLQTGRVRGGILADCMGLGKTVQVLALIATSLLRERDPDGAAAWLATTSSDTTQKKGMSFASTKDERHSMGSNSLQSAAEPETVWVISPPSSQTSGAPSSPVSVSSDAEPVEAQLARRVASCRPSDTDCSATKPKRPQLRAADPRLLRRTLKRDKDNLLPGGTLIVVPLSLVGQWHSEVERHLVHGVATVMQYYGPARPREPELVAAHTIVLTTYQTLASDFRCLAKLAGAAAEDTGALPAAALTIMSREPLGSPLASIRFRRLILDEGHMIKNTSSLLNRACNALNADARWVLTGTPLQNDLSDAFALVQFLRVSPMGSRRWWRTKVTQTMERGMIRAAIKTVRGILLPLMLRRHGDDLGEDGKPLLPLPPLTVHTFKLRLTYEEKLFYQTVFEHSKAKFDQLVQSGQVLQHYTHVLQLLLRLRQACSHPLLPSYREDLRSQKLVDALCSSHDPSLASTKQVGMTAPSLSLPLLCAADPCLTKLVEDAVSGSLRECPICFEVPREAVVLMNCWHTLCMTCALLLQSSSKGAAAACPTCRQKFLPQHVRRLPAAPRPSGERWRRVVLSKHHALVATAQSKNVGSTSKEPAFMQAEAQAGDATGTSLPPSKSGAAPDKGLPVGPRHLAPLEEVPFQGISEGGFFFSTKMRLLLALLEADITAGRSCVIFSQWTSMLDLLETALERAEAARRSLPYTSDTTAEPNDDVMEVRDPAQENTVGTSNKHSTRHRAAPLPPISGTTPQVQQQAPPHRLYHYRRIDGTLSLESRQRIIKWFLEPEAALTAPAAGTIVAPPAEDEMGPFIGRCGLKPFSEIDTCPQNSREIPCDSAPTSLQQGGKTPRALSPFPRQLGKILLLSLKTGNVGLNLVKATRCYLLDGWWNPQVETQAMRRIWRYGQDKPVSVYRFTCTRTVEERMEELVEWKERLSRNTLRGDNGLETFGAASAEESEEEDRKKGRLSLQELKKLFEGWDADEESL